MAALARNAISGAGAAMKERAARAVRRSPCRIPEESPHTSRIRHFHHFRRFLCPDSGSLALDHGPHHRSNLCRVGNWGGFGRLAWCEFFIALYAIGDGWYPSFCSRVRRHKRRMGCSPHLALERKCWIALGGVWLWLHCWFYICGWYRGVSGGEALGPQTLDSLRDVSGQRCFVYSWHVVACLPFGHRLGSPSSWKAAGGAYHRFRHLG